MSSIIEDPVISAQSLSYACTQLSTQIGKISDKLRDNTVQWFNDHKSEIDPELSALRDGVELVNLTVESLLGSIQTMSDEDWFTNGMEVRNAFDQLNETRNQLAAFKETNHVIEYRKKPSFLYQHIVKRFARVVEDLGTISKTKVKELGALLPKISSTLPSTTTTGKVVAIAGRIQLPKTAATTRRTLRQYEFSPGATPVSGWYIQKLDNDRYLFCDSGKKPVLFQIESNGQLRCPTGTLKELMAAPTAKPADTIEDLFSVDRTRAVAVQERDRQSSFKEYDISDLLYQQLQMAGVSMANKTILETIGNIRYLVPHGENGEPAKPPYMHVQSLNKDAFTVIGPDQKAKEVLANSVWKHDEALGELKKREENYFKDLIVGGVSAEALQQMKGPQYAGAYCLEKQGNGYKLSYVTKPGTIAEKVFEQMPNNCWKCGETTFLSYIQLERSIVDAMLLPKNSLPEVDTGLKTWNARQVEEKLGMRENIRSEKDAEGFLATFDKSLIQQAPFVLWKNADGQLHITVAVDKKTQTFSFSLSMNEYKIKDESIDFTKGIVQGVAAKLANLVPGHTFAPLSRFDRATRNLATAAADYERLSGTRMDRNTFEAMCKELGDSAKGAFLPIVTKNQLTVVTFDGEKISGTAPESLLDANGDIKPLKTNLGTINARTISELMAAREQFIGKQILTNANFKNIGFDLTELNQLQQLKDRTKGMWAIRRTKESAVGKAAGFAGWAATGFLRVVRQIAGQQDHDYSLFIAQDGKTMNLLPISFVYAEQKWQVKVNNQVYATIEEAVAKNGGNVQRTLVALEHDAARLRLMKQEVENIKCPWSTSKMYFIPQDHNSTLKTRITRFDSGPNKRIAEQMFREHTDIKYPRICLFNESDEDDTYTLGYMAPGMASPVFGTYVADPASGTFKLQEKVPHMPQTLSSLWEAFPNTPSLLTAIKETTPAPTQATPAMAPPAAITQEKPIEHTPTKHFMEKPLELPSERTEGKKEVLQTQLPADESIPETVKTESIRPPEDKLPPLPPVISWIGGLISKLVHRVTRTKRYKGLVNKLLSQQNPSLMAPNVSGLNSIQEQALIWVWGLKNLTATRTNALAAMAKLPMYQQYWLYCATELGTVIYKKETTDSKKLIDEVRNTFIAAFRASTDDVKQQFLAYLDAQNESRPFHMQMKVLLEHPSASPGSVLR